MQIKLIFTRMLGLALIEGHLQILAYNEIYLCYTLISRRSLQKITRPCISFHPVITKVNFLLAKEQSQVQNSENGRSWFMTARV